MKNQENSTVGLEQPGVGAVFSQVCLYGCVNQQLMQNTVKVKTRGIPRLEQTGVGAEFSQVCLYDFMTVLINSCCRIQRK